MRFRAFHGDTGDVCRRHEAGDVLGRGLPGDVVAELVRYAGGDDLER